MLGIIRSRPWLAVKVVVSAPATRLPCTAPAAPASDCISAYMDGLAEKVLRALGRPLIHDFRHGRGRGDGVNGCHVAERIRNVANGGIAVNGHFGCH